MRAPVLTVNSQSSRKNFPIRAKNSVKPKQHMSGSLRIQSTPPAPQPPKPADDYLGRLVKLIPAEVIALYLGVKGSFNNEPTGLAVWGLVFLGLVIFVRVVATREPGKKIQLGAVVTAAVSFIFWIYATKGSIIGLDGVFGEYTKYSSVAVSVWTFIVPYIYKGD